MDPSTGSENGERISAVAAALGIPVPTIRSWERRYGFPSPARTDGKHRRYTPTEIAQLRAVRDRITRGERVGEAIAATRAELVGATANEELGLFATAAAAMDTGSLRRLLRDAAYRLGTDRAIADVAMPGMRAIGAEWRVGATDVANEHLATEVVRDWLASVATGLPPGHRGPVVLACAPGEHHTLGLEAFGVMLRARGCELRMLGADTPGSSLVAASRRARATAVVVVAHRATVRRAAVAALGEIQASASVRVVTYAGNAFASARGRMSAPGTYLGNDLVAAAALLTAALP